MLPTTKHGKPYRESLTKAFSVIQCPKNKQKNVDIKLYCLYINYTFIYRSRLIFWYSIPCFNGFLYNIPHDLKRENGTGANYV